MHTQRFTFPTCLLSRLALAAFVLLGLAGPSWAVIDQSINQTVWKMLYGVSDAQINSSTWLAADDDGDGVSNGAEMAAGTNPFSAGSAIKISTITSDVNSVYMSFPSVQGKQYVVETSTSLGTSAIWSVLSPSVQSIGDGTVQTLAAPNTGGRAFFRILVQDVDSDGDGVSDWAERTIGYNPNSGTSVGGVGDHSGIASALAAENIVTVVPVKATATQPPDAGTPATDLATVTVTRSGTLHFNTVTVNLAKSGSAVEGTDYSALPASVTFAPHVNSITLTVIPRAAPTRVSNATAIVKVMSGLGYSRGGASSASVVINPAATPNGTGLTGNYWNTTSSNYATQTANVFSLGPNMTRTDATIDFNNNANGWGSGQGLGGPTGMSPPSTTGAFSIRWKGQVMPQFSEPYSFDFKSDDGGKVWVNGLLLIDKWQSQSVTENANTITLQAGVLYDIQIEYLNISGNAEAHLYWWSPSQVKQIIPQIRLFPAPALASKATPIISSLTATGYVSVPFTFAATATNISGTVTYSIPSDSIQLPSGLTLNSSTGVISGTPATGTAGTYNIAVHATNTAAGTVTGGSILNLTIFPTGSVSREFLSTGGSKVSDIVIPISATQTDTIPTVDDETAYATNTGERLRGYIVPPKTGNYYFWLSANNAAELWISNDSQYVNKVRRATVTASTGHWVWNAQTNQQSQWLSLVAGQKYYFEVLHNTGGDTDTYVEMGWCQDDIGTVPAVFGAPNASGALTLIPNGSGTTLQGYPYSGTAPSYLFQPYDYPVVAAVSGTIYSANLGPQGSVVTQASGSANLRVDPSGASAILHFNFSGLSSPRTGYHLHVDGFTGTDSTSHSLGEIIYDIDQVDSFHPELKTADGGYIWNFASVGDFSSAAQILDAIKLGKVYLNVHSVNYGAGEIRGNLGLITGSQTPPVASAYPDPGTTDVASTDAGAARFLNQATFGASPADMVYVKANGFANWITNQLSLPPSTTTNDVVAGVTADINQPYSSALFTNTWWKYSITGPDQLRQRLAFALSEIMVTSWNNDSGPLAFNGRIMANYYDTLVNNVLPTTGVTNSGTFKGLLKAVTLTPAMGLYLNMQGNQKGDNTIGRHPNENYAREIMQLFSLGIYRMWDDGKFILDDNASLPATYTQANILGMSSLLTGWTYAQSLQANGRLPTNFYPATDYLDAMLLVPSQHELGAKLLLNNVVTPQATGLTPRVSIASITVGNPCTVNTTTDHSLQTGDTIWISNVTSGTFSPTINAAFQATVTGARSFTVPVNCTSIAGIGYTNAAVTGATVTSATFLGSSGLAAITGSQADSVGSTLPHPYDQFGLNELDTAITNIVNNDNVPPYICRQLIQRLVTSTPSPGYLYRVVQKFKDNGSGVRGDMVAVIKQILLDGEARSYSTSYSNPAFGKQREPLLRLSGPARAFPATAYTGTYVQLSGIDSNKLRLTTSAPNSFNSGFSVSLDFSGNYTTTSPPNPSNNPTSTSYNVAATQQIISASTDIASITPGSPTTITTVQPHGLSTGNTVSISGVSGTFVTTLDTTNLTVTVIDGNNFTVPINTTRTFQIASIATGNPCTITTTAAHGLTTGNSVTINGVVGGTFGTAINGTFTVTAAGGPTSTTFTVASNCTVAPTSYSTWREVSSPCRITTLQPHGLTTGNTVSIAGISGGTFSPSINSTYTVTTVDATSFTVASNCTVPATSFTSAQIVGTSTLDVVDPGIINVTYTQLANSSTLTVNTAGPTTGATVPGTATIINSRVYLAFLTQTGVGGAGIPASGIYDVQTNGSNIFTVTTTDTPTTARAGNVMIPKVASSYTPQSSNTVVQFNTNVNHYLTPGAHVWVDAPVVTSPLTDAEYVVNSPIIDEDHFTTSYLPGNTNGGTYPKPSGANDGATLWPLVAPPVGRSGSVKIASSTFSLGSTESTLTQSPLNSPTVFNFFFPNYKYPGALANSGLDSPEFQLTTDTNVATLTNSIANMFIGTGGGNSNLNGLSSFNNGQGSVVMDISPYMTDAQVGSAGLSTLIDTLANLLVGATLETSTKSTIQTFVSSTTYFPLNTPTGTDQQKRDRVRAIIHLILTSAEYAVQK